MVRLAGRQGPRAGARAAAAAALRLLARQRTDVPDAGLVSPQLPRAFAVPTAYGDLSAAVLALLAVACVRAGNVLAAPLVWLFNVVGFLDLLYANISTFRDHVDPAWLGASYYLAVLNVPAMVVVHIMIFVYLLRRQPRQWRPSNA
jgi:hypothetical protein